MKIDIKSIKRIIIKNRKKCIGSPLKIILLPKNSRNKTVGIPRPIIPKIPPRINPIKKREP